MEASSQQPTALVVGVVLAAGAAERMGNAKQLLPYKGAILLQHAVDAAEASRLDGVIVVTGAYADEVEAALRVDRAVTVRNPDFRRGNMSSLEVGAAAAPQADAVMLLMGDHPGVKVAVIDEMLELWRRQRPWAATAAYRDRVGKQPRIRRGGRGSRGSRRVPGGQHFLGPPEARWERLKASAPQPRSATTRVLPDPAHAMIWRLRSISLIAASCAFVWSTLPSFGSLRAEGAAIAGTRACFCGPAPSLSAQESSGNNGIQNQKHDSSYHLDCGVAKERTDHDVRVRDVRARVERNQDDSQQTQCK